jgi:two-component system cell cycle sensor histidine kinase/response regulator CckA
MKVLVVDDSQTVRHRLVGLLSTLPGVEQVETAAEASEARHAILSARPDVVVLDIHMPRGSGIEVLEALRGDDQRVTTIVLTNDPTPQWRAACLRVGADFFFDKSAEFQQAVDVVARLALGRAAPGDRLPPCWTCFERLPIPAWIFDVDTLEFRAVNDEAVDRYGYSREEFLAMTMVDIRPPETVPALMDQIARRRVGTTIQPVATHQHRAKDGGLIHVEVAMIPFDRAGRRLDLVIAHDISERMRLEQRLRQALKMEAIGRLAGGVAHDFNNLLTVILGYAEFMAADAGLSEQQQRDVGEIIKAAKRSAGLTKRLLAFSRKQVLQSTVVDVNAMVASMSDMLGRLIGEHIELVTALAPDLGPVLADQGQLEQVLMNLTVNARDAMQQGGRVVIETAEVQLDQSSGLPEQAAVPGTYVMLAVTDSGMGMEPHTKARLFEPFFTTKERGKGTGLGLAMVYGIVKQSGGYIWVDSELGHGTTFKVYLPRSGAGTQPDVVATVVPTPHRGAQTVLLVEDEDSVRHLARRILEDAGYRVLQSSSAGEAREQFAQHRGSIDIVLTDVVMPGLSGPDLFRSLADQEPALKVLYMSGYTEDAIALQAGLDRRLPFVQKPFTAAVLARTLREALG